jgi:hypothetical protein
VCCSAWACRPGLAARCGRQRVLCCADHAPAAVPPWRRLVRPHSLGSWLAQQAACCPWLALAGLAGWWWGTDEVPGAIGEGVRDPG